MWSYDISVGVGDRQSALVLRTLNLVPKNVGSRIVAWCRSLEMYQILACWFTFWSAIKPVHKKTVYVVHKFFTRLQDTSTGAVISACTMQAHRRVPAADKDWCSGKCYLLCSRIKTVEKWPTVLNQKQQDSNPKKKSRALCKRHVNGVCMSECVRRWEPWSHEQHDVQKGKKPRSNFMAKKYGMGKNRF